MRVLSIETNDKKEENGNVRMNTYISVYITYM